MEKIYLMPDGYDFGSFYPCANDFKEVLRLLGGERSVYDLFCVRELNSGMIDYDAIAEAFDLVPADECEDQEWYAPDDGTGRPKWMRYRIKFSEDVFCEQFLSIPEQELEAAIERQLEEATPEDLQEMYDHSGECPLYVTGLTDDECWDIAIEMGVVREES